MDPLSLVAMASTTFKGLQVLVSRGAEIEHVAQKLGHWYTLVSDINQAEREAENPPLFKKMFDGSSVEEQALNAARSRNGMIDEGNLIYIFDLGINAAQAQAEVFSYLQWENELVKQGKAPEHHHTVQWLEGCAEKWKHCPTDFANSRGFQIMDRTSLTNTPLLKDASDAA